LAWDGSHARRITITEAIQPRSNGLYMSHGLMPVTPVLTMSGTPGLGPIVGRDRESAGLVLSAQLARERTRSNANVQIPRTAISQVAAALDSRLSFTADPGLLLHAPPGHPPPTALTIHSYWLHSEQS